MRPTLQLSIVLTSIATACKAITAAVRRAGLQGLHGLQGTSNVTGDEQKKLDVISNDIFINSLKYTGANFRLWGANYERCSLGISTRESLCRPRRTHRYAD